MTGIKKLRITLLVKVISLLFFSLSATGQGSVKIRVIPDQATGGSVSEIFKEVNYIPLETKKESLFGKIDQLAVTDSFFVILDYDVNAILIFLRNGQFRCKIEGGNESKRYHPLGILSFFVDKAKGEVLYLLGDTRLLVYNLNGEKIREENILPSWFCYSFPGNRTVCCYFNSSDKSTGEEVRNELFWLNNGTVYRSALPYNSKDPVFAASDWTFKNGTAFCEGENDTIAYYSRPYDYTIYQVTPETIEEKYSFLFPASISIPVDFRTNRDYLEKRSALLKDKYSSSIAGIINFHKIGDCLSFSLFSRTYLQNNTFFYHRGASKLISLDHVTPDTSNSFLPLRTSFLFTGFHSADEKFFYSSVASVDMFNNRDMNRKRKLKYPDVLNNYFSRAKRTDNPVIVQLMVNSKSR